MESYVLPSQIENLAAPASAAGSLPISAEIDRLFSAEGRKIFASLASSIGDFDIAEDALQEAFRVAVEKWPIEGMPASPIGWIASTARHKAIDSLRRRQRLTGFVEGVLEPVTKVDELSEQLNIPDERLRLMFTCCHPSLSIEAQIALTLREVCGLTTEEIARAFLAAPSTIAQRIVRAKTKIREAKIPFEAPEPHELQARLQAILKVVYLVFNEGYSATSGVNALRVDLSEEAIRLGELVADLSNDPEARGLVALMELIESRRDARIDGNGDLILIGDQDRELWDRVRIERGKAEVQQALQAGSVGPYTIQAAIAAVHADAKSLDETDWAEIAGLYEVLLALEPSSVIELNHAVAISMRDGAEAGLEILERIEGSGELENYHLFFAAKAEMYDRIGQSDCAVRAYSRALELASQEPERRFLRRKITECEKSLK